MKENMCHIDGMVGEFPDDIELICKRLKSVNAALKNGQPLPKFGNLFNRLLLYGAPGNGKTTIAQKIAEASGSKLFQLNGAGIIGRFYGQGAETIEQVFKDLNAHVNLNNQMAILFVDEIDSLANATNTCTSDGQIDEHHKALTTLWLNLDKIKGDSRIFVICATNNIDKSSKTLLSRFTSKIEIQSPDFELRKTFLEKLQKEQDLGWSQNVVEWLALQTNGFSMRNLESLCDVISRKTEKNKGVLTKDILKCAIRKVISENEIHPQLDLCIKTREKIAKASKDLITGDLYIASLEKLNREIDLANIPCKI